MACDVYLREGIPSDLGLLFALQHLVLNRNTRKIDSFPLEKLDGGDLGDRKIL